MFASIGRELEVWTLENYFLFESHILQKEKKERDRVRERKRENLPFVGSLPKRPQMLELSCSDPKPRARIFLQVSHMGTGTQGLGPSLLLPRHISRELGQEVEQLGHDSVTLWDAGTTIGCLDYYASTASPQAMNLLVFHPSKYCRVIIFHKSQNFTVWLRYKCKMLHAAFLYFTQASRWK